MKIRRFKYKDAHGDDVAVEEEKKYKDSEPTVEEEREYKKG